MKNIDDCFERGLLRKVEPSRTKSDQSLLQAGEWLSEAEKNLEAEALRSADLAERFIERMERLLSETKGGTK